VNPAPPDPGEPDAGDEDGDGDATDDAAGGGDAGASGATRSSFVADDADRGQRIDAVVARRLGLSRSRAAALVDAGHVVVDARPCRPAHRTRVGEVVVAVVPPAAPTSLVAEDLPLRFVYDDDDLCVIDKPPGLVVHPAVGHETGTIANALLFRFPALSVGGERRPGIVHRLDKDTSGLLVVAKHDESLRALAAQFQQRTVDKRYVAVCSGVPGEVGVVFDVVTGHARHGSDRRRFSTRLPVPDTDDARGGVRRAASRFCVRAAGDGIAVVDVELLTGRTHQIRAHLADRGHPLLQDGLYGGAHAERRLRPGPVREAVAQLGRQALHAARLGFLHPRSQQPLSFASPLPADLARVVDAVAGA
jgi:23S rRNA pseudouridine1911/1915/1917 synthase